MAGPCSGGLSTLHDSRRPGRPPAKLAGLSLSFYFKDKVPFTCLESRRSERAQAGHGGWMMHGRNRWLLRLAILLVAGLAFLVWFRRERSQDLLVIENRSKQPIALLRVTIAGQTSTFQDV